MSGGLVVLIAENDRDTREYVRRCVERHGLALQAILEARDGREALSLVRQRRVDLLITDGVMPRLDGFALCEALRREGNGQQTAVLVITGQYDFREAARRAAAAGADGVLVKPFNARMLCEEIDAVLEARSSSASEPGADPLVDP